MIDTQQIDGGATRLEVHVPSCLSDIPTMEANTHTCRKYVRERLLYMTIRTQIFRVNELRIMK